MSGFKMGSSDLLVLRQRGGVIVFLESEDDFQILSERWFFDEGQDVTFRPADAYEPGPGGGGCQAVIDLVQKARAAGISAFGVVDRDVLLSNHDWPLWWQNQDQTFLAARPYGHHIRVLVRWELENYLLEPPAMAIEANDLAMVSTHTTGSIVNLCLECADEFKDRSAATVAAKSANLSPPGDGFGCQKPPLFGPDLRAALEQHLGGKGLNNPAAALTAERAQIEQFDAPGATAQDRWNRLVRMLDGKAALKYLSCRTGIQFDQRRAGLARRMFENGTVPPEIRQYIADFKGAA